MEPNLADLDRNTPGASRICVWTGDGQIVDLPSLSDPDRPGPTAWPTGAIAVGVIWPIRHVADGVRLRFDGRPPAEPPALQVFDGSRWIPWADDLTCRIEGQTLELAFAPVAAAMLRVLLPPDSPVARIEVHRYLAEATQIDWPRRVATPELTQDFLRRDEEPSFEALSLHGLSSPTWALTGLKDTGREQAVAWDGQIHCHGRRIRLALGESRVTLDRYRDTCRRSLIEGWMPAVRFEAQAGPLRLSQTSFAIFTDDAAQRHEAMFVCVEVANLGPEAFQGPLDVEAFDAPPDPFEGTLGVEIIMPPPDRTPSTWRAHAAGIDRNGRPFLVTADPCRPGADPATITFHLALAAGQKATIRLAVPSPDWPITPAEGAALASFPHGKALDLFKSYWGKLLAPSMRLSLPEKRLEYLYKNVLAQIFISGYGDSVTYGAAPSNYDGAAFAGEVPFAINALAMSGLADDAHRYFNGSMPKPKQEITVDAPGGPGVDQAIPLSLHIVSAIDLIRLTRDLAWARRKLEILRRGCDWILARRRETMKLEDGARPLHFGLLPTCPSGGDFSRPGYALFPNFACWRGLKDLAWLLDTLGDADAAARYRAEADDFHRTLLGVVDRITQRNRNPAFLPLLTDETEPRHGDYYQLQSHFILNLWPFELADPRSDLIPDFIAADNRTLCMLPRFRDDGQPQSHRKIGDGGIDGIYALGLLSQRLQQGRVREFLLGFYAFQAFNMEHDCFTSREGNRVFASDLHLRSPFALSDWSDPLTCSSAVALLLLRHLLVTEEVKGAGEYTGRLLLLHGAPRRWYAPGERIAVEGAVTHAGSVSFEVHVSADGSRMHATITLPPDSPCPAVQIRLRHFEGRAIKAVSINGRPETSFNPQEESVVVPRPAGTTRVEATY